MHQGSLFGFSQQMTEWIPGMTVKAHFAIRCLQAVNIFLNPAAGMIVSFQGHKTQHISVTVSSNVAFGIIAKTTSVSFSKFVAKWHTLFQLLSLPTEACFFWMRNRKKTSVVFSSLLFLCSRVASCILLCSKVRKIILCEAFAGDIIDGIAIDVTHRWLQSLATKLQPPKKGRAGNARLFLRLVSISLCQLCVCLVCRTEPSLKSRAPSILLPALSSTQPDPRSQKPEAQKSWQGISLWPYFSPDWNRRMFPETRIQRCFWVKRLQRNRHVLSPSFTLSPFLTLGSLDQDFVLCQTVWWWIKLQTTEKKTRTMQWNKKCEKHAARKLSQTKQLPRTKKKKQLPLPQLYLGTSCCRSLIPINYSHHKNILLCLEKVLWRTPWTFEGNKRPHFQLTETSSFKKIFFLIF